eukprot:g22385.t1
MLGRGLVSPLPLDLWILQMLAVTGAAVEKFESRAKAAYVAALFCGVECLMSGCTAVLDRGGLRFQHGDFCASWYKAKRCPSWYKDHCFMLKFEEAEAACRAYEDLGLRVFFAPMLNDDAVLYENYVPVALDAEERNAQGQGGGLGPEGRWRTTSGPSNEAKCQANLALWEDGRILKPAKVERKHPGVSALAFCRSVLKSCTTLQTA